MAIDRSMPIGPGTSTRTGAAAVGPASASGPSFHDILRQASAPGSTGRVQFSSHAQKRADKRDLNLDAPTMTRLNNAIDRAAAKGSRSSLVMLDGLAVVVDVRDRTVVTAMNTTGAAGQPGKEKVFTNIDSVVVA